MDAKMSFYKPQYQNYQKPKYLCIIYNQLFLKVHYERDQLQTRANMVKGEKIIKTKGHMTNKV